MPSRMLFRRFLALLIDWTLVALITTLLLYPIVRGKTDQIRLSSSNFSQTCQRAVSAPSELVQFIKNAHLWDWLICENRPFFLIENGLTAKLFYSSSVRKNGGRPFKTITIDINSNGLPIDVVKPQGILSLALTIVASAFFLIAANGRTPGKYLLDLRVVNISRRNALNREFWRFAPMIPITLILALPNSILRIPVQNGWLLAGPLIAIMALLVWYYIYPIIRWNGALRHDNIAGTKIVRAEIT